MTDTGMTKEQAIKVLLEMMCGYATFSQRMAIGKAIQALKQPEFLTYEEQCIFLAAMRREYKLSEKIDKNQDLSSKSSLTYICKEIVRKVKLTLWG